VATQHFLEPNHARRQGVKSWPGRLAHQWVNAQTHQLIAISEAVRQRMLARGEAETERITVVPNGLACGSDGLPTVAQTRADWGVPLTAPLIVCVARLEPEKDIRSLLAAMPTVLQARPDTRALVVGDGSQRQALENELHKRGITHSVRFAGFREDALAFIQAGDVFVLPSVAEPFGLVLLEAMALGKPVIATCAGGPREIVIEGETGLLVPPSQPPALAAAILDLLADPEKRGRLGRNGRRRYQEFYSVERMAAETSHVYRKALGV